MKNKIVRAFLTTMMCSTFLFTSVSAAEPGTADAAVTTESEIAVDAETPAETETPVETGTPAETETPTETETPAEDETETPAEAETPAEDETSAADETPAESETSAEAEEAAVSVTADYAAAADTAFESPEGTENSEKTAKASVTAVYDAASGDSSLTLEHADALSDGESYMAAVWSEKNGQDDIGWFGLSANEEGTYSTSFITGYLSSSGTCHVHVYKFNSKYQPVSFVTGTTFSYTATPSITIEQPGSDGTGYISVSNVTLDAGVKEIRAAVWSKADQSDLKWIPLSAQGKGGVFYHNSYQVADCGTWADEYILHVYAIDGNGAPAFLGGKRVTLPDAPADSFSFALHEGENYATVTATGAAKNISVAVWSEKNGQDDLTWYDLRYFEENDTWQKHFSLSSVKSAGKVFVHAYKTNPDGSKTFIGGTTFELASAAPTAGNAGVTYYDRNANEFLAGSFSIYAEHVVGATELTAAVWSKPDQSDLKWYPLSDPDSSLDTISPPSNTCGVTGRIADYHYAAGTYYVHIYAKDRNGKMVPLKCDTFTVTDPVLPSVSVSGPSYSFLCDGSYSLQAQMYSVPEDVVAMRYAIWSESNGQDDLKWVQGDGSSFYISLPETKLKSGEKYIVHAYATKANGQEYFFAGTAFTAE